MTTALPLKHRLCAADMMSAKSVTDMVSNAPQPMHLGNGQIVLSTRGPGEFVGELGPLAGLPATCEQCRQNTDAAAGTCSADLLQIWLAGLGCANFWMNMMALPVHTRGMCG